MENQFERTELLLGKDAIQKLKNAHVAVFGVGGVGGFVVEALVRSGVGEIDVIDKDTVSLSNINRQIIALHSTVGQPKVELTIWIFRQDSLYRLLRLVSHSLKTMTLTEHLWVLTCSVRQCHF